MSDLVEFRTNGIVCDNEKCDWKDNTIPIEAFIHFVNAECPKCGEVLLTVEDFQSFIEVNTIVKMFNNMTEEQVKAFGMNPDPKAKKSHKKLKFKDGKIYEI